MVHAYLNERTPSTHPKAILKFLILHVKKKVLGKLRPGEVTVGLQHVNKEMLVKLRLGGPKNPRRKPNSKGPGPQNPRRKPNSQGLEP